MASRNFFKRAVRTLPFCDVLRHCDTVTLYRQDADPIKEYCLPEIQSLPFELLQQVGCRVVLEVEE